MTDVGAMRAPSMVRINIEPCSHPWYYNISSIAYMFYSRAWSLRAAARSSPSEINLSGWMCGNSLSLSLSHTHTHTLSHAPSNHCTAYASV